MRWGVGQPRLQTQMDKGFQSILLRCSASLSLTSSPVKWTNATRPHCKLTCD